MKVAVGLSGGVDSALSAALLVEQGYEVTGIFLECYNEPGCRTDEDRQDALKVALKLKIPFRVLDFKQEYRRRVLDWSYAEFKKGRTPNPDVWCNREIKFGLFLEWVLKNGFDFVATGHYAQVKDSHLLRSVDKDKDQTYFLAMLTEKELNHVLFPVGHLTKKDVRAEAKKRGLAVWAKKDSTGICFIGHDLGFKQFLAQKIKVHPGEVVDKTGQAIGRHDGVEFYTIGQRHGFTIQNQTNHQPALFVIQKDIKSNRLIVGNKTDLAKKEFEVEGWNWIGMEPKKEEGLQVRIRHQGKLIGCKIKGMKVLLNRSEFGIAPGQVAVIYGKQECMGGGVIR